MLSLKEKICISLSGLKLSLPQKLHKLLELFDSPEQLWSNFPSKKTEIEAIIGSEGFLKLSELFCDGFVNQILAEYTALKIVPLTLFSEKYPETLKEIFEPPIVLYCLGDIELLNSECVSVIGTRKADAYGKRVAKTFVPKLCGEFTIVSGLAYGIDTAAHELTLENSGKTIAVLGSALNKIYPAANCGLARQIVASGGLIITEYELGRAPSQFHFPMRNRIVSALSRALLVIQAPLKSGVFSTIDYAIEQGKEVFVVPGEIYSENCAGSNDVLKRIQGALVTCPEDIFAVLKPSYVSGEAQKAELKLDSFERHIAIMLKDGGKTHFDELIRQSQMPVGELNYILASLELKGIISKLAGNIYQYICEEKII